MENLSWNAANRTLSQSGAVWSTGCADGKEWGWDGDRVLLARQWHMDCDEVGADGEPPDPIQDFPTTPPTEQPAVIAPQV